MQGFYFCPAAIQPHISVYSVFCVVHAELYRPRHKTVHRALQWLFLQLHPFNHSRNQTDTSGYNTTCATLERIHTPGRPPARTKYHRHAGTLHRSAQPPYYNKVYKGAACYRSMPDSAADRRPCQPGGGQLSPSADRWQVLHPVHLLRG